MYEMRYARSWGKVYTGGQGATGPWSTMGNTIITEHLNNPGSVSDPKIDNGIADVLSTSDPDEAMAKLRDVDLYMRARMWIIPIPAKYEYCYWWPWLKGYSGEVSLALYAYHKPFMYTWLDQDLKKEMGY